MAPRTRTGDPGAIVPVLTRWFDREQRTLPWRATTPWGVLVSEFMLQQTPVDRVLPLWHTWMDRWPTACALAGSAQSEAIRAWGRLGYPRRAQRLHQTAQLICERHGGQVPQGDEELRALPGVGEYTAAAIRAFAFGRRSVVLDTNVRRVLVRVLEGRAQPTAHLTAAERASADLIWPRGDQQSAQWSAAVMEFGALKCTARDPSCDSCPVQANCAWHRAGRPAASQTPRRQPRYEGSDRQARGRLLAELRSVDRPVTAEDLRAAWPVDDQRARALAGLVADGLVAALPRHRYALRD